ncbi:MAG: alanine--glyoxylate aminotransferase family protein [Comamonadaceae bacterium]|nr:MAG: alanine--glyoxylate aminotransferase family protein [Comamonadaceae bacterium]
MSNPEVAGVPGAGGRSYLAIPGPSVVPERVLTAMHVAAPDIYGDALAAVAAGIDADLKALVRTRHHVAVYIANGHGAWEAANANMFSRGDTALVLITGLFGEGWAKSAEAMGVRVQRLDFGLACSVDPDAVESTLRADTERRIRVVLVSHVDTSTSVRNDLAALRAAIDAAGHAALLAVDAIASLGCETMEMDRWSVDVMVGASQKGLMTPPGLGFVWVSDKALRACSASDCRTPYWDWTTRVRPSRFYQRFGGTAPTHHLFGLQVALRMIVHEEGVEAVWHRHTTLARAVWAAFDSWAEGRGAESAIAMNVAIPADRSHSVTTVRFSAPLARQLRQWVQANTGVTLGIGVGMVPDGHPEADAYLRVAHMGHVNAHMTLGALACLEAAMAALRLGYGPGGVAAAAAVLADGLGGGA